jgi:hypothetical protein
MHPVKPGGTKIDLKPSGEQRRATVLAKDLQQFPETNKLAGRCRLASENRWHNRTEISK